MIEGLTDTSFYVEQKTLINIEGTTSINSEGVIKIDEESNSLVSTIDCGDGYLNSVLTYTGDKSLLLYNTTMKKYQLVTQDDDISIPLDFELGLNYCLEAEVVGGVISDYSRYKFTLDTPIKNVFKIFLDGYEITKYITGDLDENSEFSEISIIDSQVIRVDEFSEISVIAYESTVPTETLYFKLNYYGYTTIWSFDEFSEAEYFESGFLGMELQTISDISISQDVTSTSSSKPFSNRKDKIINKIENTLELTTFNYSESRDFVHYIKNNYFRFIMNNMFYGKTTILNDCKIDDGYSTEVGEKITKEFSIEFGNLIEVDYSEDLGGYGSGLYGKGEYGSRTSVINSSRGGL